MSSLAQRHALWALAALTACSSAFTNTYHPPGADVDTLRGKRLVAIVVGRSSAVRRTAEDVLAQRVSDGSTKCVPSYTFLPDSLLSNPDSVKARVRQGGFAGAVVLRLKSREEKEKVQSNPTYYTSAEYGSFWGWYNLAGAPAYDPAYVGTENVVSVETLVYQLNPDKLLWAGTTKPMTVDRVNDFTRQVAQESADQMRKEGVLK